MIIEYRPISPSLAAVYRAIDCRERLESLLEAGVAAQMVGIAFYGWYHRRAQRHCEVRSCLN